MFRAFPSHEVSRAAPSTSADVHDAIENLQIAQVSHTRQLGFLNLVSDVTKQLGSLAEGYVSHLLTVICSILEYSVGRAKASESGVGSLRTLCLHRMSEFFGQFPNFDYSPWETSLVDSLSYLSTSLPSSMINASAPSALLNCIYSAAQYVPLHRLLRSCSTLIPQTIRCLSAGVEKRSRMGPSALSCVLSIIESLIPPSLLLPPKVSRRKIVDPDIVELDALRAPSFKALLLPNIPLMLEEFGTVFEASTSNQVQTVTMARELRIITAVSKVYHDKGIGTSPTEICGKLAGLLLPFLAKRPPKDLQLDVSHDSRKNVIDTIAGLVPMLPDPGKFVPYLSRLLAPGDKYRVFPSKGFSRQGLANLFLQIYLHHQEKYPWLKDISSLLVDLNARDKTRVDWTYDFKLRLGAYEKINAGDCFLASLEDYQYRAKPLMYQLLHDMHDEEYVIRSSAQTAIVGIVRRGDTGVLQSVIVPILRSSLKSTSHEVRRGFLVVASEIGRLFNGATEEVVYANMHLHSDLSQLVNEEEKDLDFFPTLLTFSCIGVHGRLDDCKSTSTREQ